ncbi:uncharacterized protein N7484_011037 [Penicillium longicatenatum]|uniref:uncharacterized protein n=1 Tax=Penicillium longicatenatum TaxID=1561947 RepID=UPI0025486DEA|nr:uncharacterized protein N7484_011037 [Penicillium longicatenatum]KAJ5630937.1 hypothetical protein N7484_011037 [Penicillium longicatenatum]
MHVQAIQFGVIRGAKGLPTWAPAARKARLAKDRDRDVKGSWQSRESVGKDLLYTAVYARFVDR